MAAQQRNKHTGRAKRIVVAAVALVALVAVGIAQSGVEDVSS